MCDRPLDPDLRAAATSRWKITAAAAMAASSQLQGSLIGVVEHKIRGHRRIQQGIARSEGGPSAVRRRPRPRIGIVWGSDFSGVRHSSPGTERKVKQPEARPAPWRTNPSTVKTTRRITNTSASTAASLPESGEAYATPLSQGADQKAKHLSRFSCSGRNTMREGTCTRPPPAESARKV